MVFRRFGLRAVLVQSTCLTWGNERECGRVLARVIPDARNARAGIQGQTLDSRFRGNDSRGQEAAAMRALMNRLGAVAYCELRFCKRAGQCMHPKARRFWQNLTIIQKRVFPAMWRKVEGMKAQGVEFNFPPPLARCGCGGSGEFDPHRSKRFPRRAALPYIAA
jgi:hypothetical protein